MLPLNKKLWKTMKWGAIIGLGIDAVSLAGGYYLYHQLTRSRDFRYKVFNYDPRILDVYYRANEKYGDGKIRHEDLEKWGVREIKSFENLSLFGL
ncbi:protein CEBPZOS [Parasteatoda tepidariorum]|uniref:protein CEBPZOS n=1 Tax=Parasteatoda tepidariorum TaxID=114398 RepID=UPI00077FE058|nr:protein CEBPZOS-like [Parasteatoda tepidariorum]